MWSRLIGGLSFLMQAALVVAAVLVFSFFDPFNIFGSKQKTLKDTPVSVASIREIGELITAEYYGEVLGSLQEVNIENLDSNIYRLGKVDSAFAFAMADMRNRNLEFKGLFRKRKIERYFEDNYSFIRNDPYYTYLMEYLEEALHLGNEKQVLKYYYDNANPKAEIDKEVLSQLSKQTRRNFVPDKKLLKKQIVMLGRGTVRAGYKFDSFNESNFKYSSLSNIVYFIGLEPKILSCNINPWFIPEKKVKGFELILYTGKADKPEYMAQVKEKCVAELRESALQKDILTQAENNARENLKSFFALLLGHPLTDVVFMNSKPDVYMNEIRWDGKITNYELSTIDTLIAEFNNGSTRNALRDSLHDLMQLPFEFNHVTDSFNCYSSLADRIAADNTVDSAEYATLYTLADQIAANKPIIPHDSCFFRDNFFINDSTKGDFFYQRKKAYGEMIETLKRNVDKLINMEKQVYSAKDIHDKVKPELRDSINEKLKSLNDMARKPEGT